MESHQPKKNAGASHDQRLLQQALTNFELSNKSTDKGSTLDAIARLAAGGDVVAIREVVRIVLEMRIAENPVRSVLVDPADVDDAIQATLIIVATRISSFEGTSSFKTWTGTIAKNEALQIVRRKQRKTEPATNELPEQGHSTQHLSSLIANESVYAEAVRSLSDEHQEVLQLREELDLTYDEISERLDLAVGTVRSRISRARLLLADRLVAANPDRTMNGQT